MQGNLHLSRSLGAVVCVMPGEFCLLGLAPAIARGIAWFVTKALRLRGSRCVA